MEDKLTLDNVGNDWKDGWTGRKLTIPTSRRSYCEDCLNTLVGKGTFDSLKHTDPWICFLCQPHVAHGALMPRLDWSIRVQELFTNNSGIEFVSVTHPKQKKKKKRVDFMRNWRKFSKLGKLRSCI